jgi:hypothetical protein
MSNFLKLTSQIENQLGQFATRLLRIEAHVRQGDLRAATHRLDGFFQELDEFEDDMEFPIELVVVGSQLGFLSGNGSWIRGRIPAAMIGGAAGWLFGQSAAHEYRETIQELKLRAQAIALQLEEAAASAEAAPSGSAGGAADQETGEPDEQTGGAPAE